MELRVLGLGRRFRVSGLGVRFRAQKGSSMYVCVYIYRDR